LKYSSTCFGHPLAHHQELVTAVAASGLPLERDGSSAVGRGRSDRTYHDQRHGYHHVPTVNQRRLLQLQAPDDEQKDARNMLSCISTTSNKSERLMHLVA